MSNIEVIWSCVLSLHRLNPPVEDNLLKYLLMLCMNVYGLVTEYKKKVMFHMLQRFYSYKVFFLIFDAL